MYIVYQTTCIVNMKYYIGVHWTKTKEDKKKYYFGSGKALKAAIRKYGIHNFIRETLYTFKTREEAYRKEAELVTQDLVDDPMCYNVTVGGNGAKQENVKQIPWNKGLKNCYSEAARKKMSEGSKGKKLSPEHIEKIREMNRARALPPEEKAQKTKARTELKIQKDGKDERYCLEIILAMKNPKENQEILKDITPQDYSKIRYRYAVIQKCKWHENVNSN